MEKGKGKESQDMVNIALRMIELIELCNEVSKEREEKESLNVDKVEGEDK